MQEEISAVQDEHSVSSVKRDGDAASHGELSVYSMPGLRSGSGAGQHNSNAGARPSAPFRSNVYQPTEMTMILNGGAVSTSAQSQVHAAFTPLSHSPTLAKLHAHRCVPDHTSLHKNEGEV